MVSGLDRVLHHRAISVRFYNSVCIAHHYYHLHMMSMERGRNLSPECKIQSACFFRQVPAKFTLFEESVGEIRREGKWHRYLKM